MSADTNGAALVDRALGAVAAGDLDGFLACLHADLVLELPYAEEHVTQDKAGLARLIRYLIELFETRTFHVDRVHRVVGSDRLIVEYRSDFVARSGAVRYENRYVGIFEFCDGLISRWVEYANPVPFNRAMAAISG